MKLKQWLEGLNYQELQGSLDVEVEDVVYDSRKAVKGAVFVCMKGTRIDSHDFIDEVAEKGVEVLVLERKLPVPKGVTAILVENGRQTLALLSAARFGHPIRKMTSIGVTGTKGKTTTTHMIKAILEACGKKVGMIGTTGAVIGDQTFPTVNTTPESYQLQEYFSKMMDAGCDYVIMEVSSQGLKMHRVDGITFDYGIFTNISPDHIGPDEHENFEEYLYYKSQLLNRCLVGIVNRDDAHYEEMIKHASCEKLFTYSLEQEADYQVGEIHYASDADFVGVEFPVTGACSLDLRVSAPGRFNVYNALAAVCVCSQIGLPADRISHGLEHLSVNGRMEIVHKSKTCTVIVDYAHNAVSMESLLTTLRDYHPKRLVCVFGCGGNRSKDRRYSMGEIAGRLADFTIITADNSRYEKVEDIMEDIRGSLEKTGGDYIQIPDRREAIFYSISHAQPGDMIAIIGKGHEDYQEINGVRYPFLDRQVVQEAAAEFDKEKE
ncbi:MAG: UDP-N-acetylmuramoyl-L-alanyl-D-glutamate--2,6-diaminopimelate ligase [Lachnospiraceae bacterium]